MVEVVARLHGAEVGGNPQIRSGLARDLGPARPILAVLVPFLVIQVASWQGPEFQGRRFSLEGGAPLTVEGCVCVVNVVRAQPTGWGL